MKISMDIFAAAFLFCAIPFPSVSISTASAQVCLDYGDYLHWVGKVDTPSPAFGVAVTGNYAYVVDEVGGLLVIDISVPESPAIVGGVDTPGLA